MLKPNFRLFLAAFSFLVSINYTYADVAYVTNEFDGTLSVIDISTNTVIDTVKIAEGGGITSSIFRIAATPDNQYLYITDGRANKVIVVQTSDNTVVSEIPIAGSPFAITTTPDGQKIYIASQFTDEVSVIDTTTNTVITTIAVDDRPLSMAVSPDGDRLYVSHIYQQGGISSPRVLVLDTSSDMIIDSINITPFSRSQDITITPDGEKAYIAFQDSDALGVLDLVTGEQIATINGLQSPSGITISPEGDIAYVLSSGIGDTNVYVIDVNTDSLVTTLNFFNAPSRADITNDGKSLYIPNTGNDTVSVLETETNALVTTIAVGHIPQQIKIVEELGRSLTEQIEDLVVYVDGADLPKQVLNSYDAQLKKVLEFLENKQHTAAKNQLKAFLKKVEQDFELGLISEEFTNEVNEMVSEILDLLLEEEAGGEPFPLITQVVSPFPSEAETTSWANASYADGRADRPGSCGATIEQCGCVISSFSMLGRHFGIEKGIDGSEVNPLNMNAWLLANDGYTPTGAIIWNKALEYLSEDIGGLRQSLIRQDAHYETNETKISSAIQQGAIGMANSTVGRRHFYLLAGLADDLYSVADPFWYNTKTLVEAYSPTLHTQNYNGTFTSAHLYSQMAEPEQLARAVEIHLASPAELLITDSKGRRLGYDPRTGETFNEIPNAQYEYESAWFSGDTTPPDPAHIEKVAYIFDPENTFFTVEVIGTGDGEYTLSMHTRDSESKSNLINIEGETALGEVDTEVLSVEQGEVYELLKELYVLADSIPESDRDKYLNALRVILDKIEKENLTAKESIVNNFIAYLTDRYTGEDWLEDIVVLLSAL